MLDGKRPEETKTEPRPRVAQPGAPPWSWRGAGHGRTQSARAVPGAGGMCYTGDYRNRTERRAEMEVEQEGDPEAHTINQGLAVLLWTVGARPSETHGELLLQRDTLLHPDPPGRGTSRQRLLVFPPLQLHCPLPCPSAPKNCCGAGWEASERSPTLQMTNCVDRPGPTQQQGLLWRRGGGERRGPHNARTEAVGLMWRQNYP